MAVFSSVLDMEPDPVTQQFHRCLNSPQFVSAIGYRRNSRLHPLVGSVNTVIGAVLSDNYEIAALFVSYAAEHMKRSIPSLEEDTYYCLVASYLAHILDHIRRAAPQALAHWNTDLIPEVLLSAGTQKAPDDSLRRNAQALKFWK
jgi:hypothetical protein